MTNNDFLNRQAPEDHIENSYEYPTLQWNNGYTGATGVLASGGFELPLSQFRNLISGEILEIPHRNGTVIEPGYLLPVMNLAIVQSHTSYYRENGDNTEWSATPLFDEGFRSRTLYFCYAAEIEQSARLTPVVLSVKSRVAQGFKNVLRDFRSQVLTTADKLSGLRCPHYFYYAVIGSNGRVFFPDAATPYTIAPPTPYWDVAIGDLDPQTQIDILRELAIPDYLYQHILSAGWDEARAWRESLANGGGDNNPAPPRNPQPPSGPAPISSEEQRMWTDNTQTFADHDQRRATPPAPPASPMSQAQVVAVAAQTMSNEEARRLFQANVSEAIRNGQIDHVTATKLRNDTDQVNAWRTLEKAMNGGLKVAA